MYPKNRNGALMALLAAGGLYAWRNRDKIQGWINNQTSQMNTGTSNTFPTTGETRRIGDETYTSDTPIGERRFGSEL